MTIQEPTEYSGAFVELHGAPQRIDGVIEVLSSGSVPRSMSSTAISRPLDSCTRMAGEAALIYDSSQPRALGEPSTSPTNFVFVERLDGTTPEHFDRNWYIHAGHSDGREAESEASLAERHREEAEAPDRLYRQNRVIEPITPTAWVLHGYTQLQLGFFVPVLGADAYPRVRGEEPFDRWPPEFPGLRVPSPVAALVKTHARRRSPMSAALEGGTAVVTGGAGPGAGLGRGLVKCLAGAGMNVAILDVDGDAASALALELRGQGRDALGLGVDVTSLDSLQAAAAEVTRVFGS